MLSQYGRCGQILLQVFLLLVIHSAAFTVAYGQNVPQLPAPGNLAGGGGSPQGSDLIPVSSGMLSPVLPKIPNLEFGFLYSFGKNLRTGRFTADYVLPYSLSSDSVLFGEAHAEGWDFWKKPSVSVDTPAGFITTTSPSSNRVDLSFGGGYRTMTSANSLLGVNGFYDASRVYNRWYSSGGIGLEYAAIIGGDAAVDLNFNWYGNLFNRDVLVNAFRNKGNSFDVEAGYSHSLFNQALDLRLKLVGYQFDIGTGVRGWRGGADLTTRNGVFTARYEYGHDAIDGYYNTVGGFVNVGFNLENLVHGESPFTLPEPVFRSPRDLRRLLGLKVKRNWHQPEGVVSARNVQQAKPFVPFSRYVYIGTLPANSGVSPGYLLLDQPISASDLVGAGQVVVTWTGSAAPPGFVSLHLYLGSSCSADNILNLAGATSPPGAQTTDPTFWTGACAGYDNVTMYNSNGTGLDFGTVTLTFLP